MSCIFNEAHVLLFFTWFSGAQGRGMTLEATLCCYGNLCSKSLQCIYSFELSFELLFLIWSILTWLLLWLTRNGPLLRRGNSRWANPLLHCSFCLLWPINLDQLIEFPTGLKLLSHRYLFIRLLNKKLSCPFVFCYFDLCIWLQFILTLSNFRVIPPQ